MSSPPVDIPGTIESTYEINGYSIIEYRPDVLSAPHYRVFVDGEDAGYGGPSLDAALAYAIAYRYEGEDTQADMYFLRAIGAEEVE